MNCGKLEALPGNQAYRPLIDYVKGKLQQLKKIPTHFREFGAIAMAEMFAANDPA